MNPNKAQTVVIHAEIIVPPNKIGKAPQANPAKMADVAFE